MRGAASAENAGPRASVVVVNYNGRHYLDTCLEALLAQELEGGFEVILVDNGSGDGSADHVRQRWPEVQLVEAGANLGFAGGNNLGIGQARGRHLVLINNDTRARPGWLAALVAAAEADARVGAVTPKLVYMDRPGVIQNAGSLLLSDGSGADRGAGEEDRGQLDAREEVFGLCGCGALLRREMLDDVGAFDEDFFAYYEDTDLSWRMRLRGWRVLYEPAAVVEHVHSGTSIEWSPFFTFHVDRNRLFMILKNAPSGFAAAAFTRFAVLAARAAARALLRRGRHTGEVGHRPPAPGPSRARLHLNVVASLLRHLPSMLARRRRIRRRRTVPDADIRRWLYPREKWQQRTAV
ncbi:MAG: glycosyltransferase family 2 protein [Chloroflexota bacterium]